MDPTRAFARIADAVERERARRLPLGDVGRLAALERRLDEIRTSTALAGSPLSRDEVATLVGAGIAKGEHRLDAYVLVADYAEAARYVEDAPGLGRRQTYLHAEEIVELHARATRRGGSDRPGAWRTTTRAPFPSGMVPPPAWLVPREMAAFVERLVAGPPAGTPAVRWVAAAHARFERIQPFATANGRVGRLVANLLLRRLGLPPFVAPPRDAGKYVLALRSADARDPWPLATLFARSALAGLLRLAAARDARGELVPLSDLVSANERGALYKAAQRGRLLATRRGGTLFSTQAWVEAYRTSRSRVRPGSASATPRKERDGFAPRDA